ncbi:MAG TPA: glucans biosynthesis glucosyltransferase MdoH [Terrimicrobiaceae bacterium]
MRPKLQPEKLTADFVAFRRATFFGAILATTGLGGWLLWRTFLPEGVSPLEWVQLILFVLLFQQIATGFWLVIYGFLTTILGGDRAQIAHSIEDDPALGEARPPPTAIVLPIYNEDVDRVFLGIEAIWIGLKQAGSSEGFDFFVLSDSNRPECWLREEIAWLELCKKLNGFGRIFYRKRRVPRNSKSGNVADFCRRWGARYRYMVVLDADSIMTGRLLTRLVAMMERNPRVGLIQTGPQLALGRTFFRRIQQFASKVYAPLFAAGSNYWHLFASNYWGHNAIVRLRPFIQYCDLPELPDPDTSRRHIFSHDTVEAALMRKAGFDVWFAYTEDGSYEEGPPNLSDSLARDRRWCLGNLQHFWFLFAPGIDFANRFHIWMGVMAYLGSPIWLLFLLVGAVDLAFKHRFSLLSALPGSDISYSGGAVHILLIATLALLFFPKILAMILAIPKAHNFGGVIRLVTSTLIETVIWTLLAPAIMLYYTQFVVTNLAGLQVRWTAQNRSDMGLGFFQSLRIFWMPPAMCIIAATSMAIWAREELLLLSPILIGWLIVPVLAWITSRPDLGDWARRHGLFLIPEENPQLSPAELRFVEQGVSDLGTAWDFPHGGIARAVIDPLTHSVHVALLRQRKAVSEETEGYLELLRQKLMEEGPGAMDPSEHFALLWDADSLRWLHHEFWSRPATRLHPWWRQRLDEVIERIGLAR